MAHPSNIHWTEDPELLEQYVMDRLTSGERTSLEAHLHACEVCQAAVRAEQELIAGVRRLGRDELRARLAPRLEKEPTVEVPWLQLASAAAVIIIIVGISVYSNWFTFHEEEEIPVQVEKDQEFMGGDEKKESVSGEIESAAPPKSTPRAAEGREDKISSPDDRRQTQGAQKQSLKKATPFVTPEGAGAEQIGALQEMSQAPTADKKSTQEKFWVQGTFLRDGETEVQDRLKILTPSKEEAEKAKEGQVFIVQDEAKDAVPQRIMLEQRAARTLAESRQLRQGEVQTLVERTEQGLHLTMYLDTPFTKSQLEQARIQPVTEDSLIVNIARQRIGYKIPGGWGVQETGK